MVHLSHLPSQPHPRQVKRDRDQENGRGRDPAEHFRVGRPDLLLGGRQRLSDAIPDARGRCLDGVAGKVCVPGGCPHLGVAEQLSDHR